MSTAKFPGSRIKLVVEQGALKGREFHFPDGEHVLGRSSAATVRFPDGDATVSGKHVVVRVNGVKVTVENLSRYGTRINGHPIETVVELHPGHRLMLGTDVELRLEMASDNKNDDSTDIGLPGVNETCPPTLSPQALKNQTDIGLPGVSEVSCPPTLPPPPPLAFRNKAMPSSSPVPRPKDASSVHVDATEVQQDHTLAVSPEELQDILVADKSMGEQRLRRRVLLIIVGFLLLVALAWPLLSGSKLVAWPNLPPNKYVPQKVENVAFLERESAPGRKCELYLLLPEKQELRLKENTAQVESKLNGGKKMTVSLFVYEKEAKDLRRFANEKLLERMPLVEIDERERGNEFIAVLRKIPEPEKRISMPDLMSEEARRNTGNGVLAYPFYYKYVMKAEGEKKSKAGAKVFGRGLCFRFGLKKAFMVCWEVTGVSEVQLGTGSVFDEPMVAVTEEFEAYCLPPSTRTAEPDQDLSVKSPANPLYAIDNLERIAAAMMANGDQNVPAMLKADLRSVRDAQKKRWNFFWLQYPQDSSDKTALVKKQRSEIEACRRCYSPADQRYLILEQLDREVGEKKTKK
jgi:hypothetical protein